MPSIISLNGSPKDGSSTGILLDTVASAVIDNSEYSFTEESYNLHELKFSFCQSCGFSPEPDYCIYHDDYYPIYQKLIDCDIILFGSPVYFDSVSAQAKAFIDRCNCLRPPDFKGETGDKFKKIIARKRLGAMVLVGGERGEFECARKVIAGWFKWIHVENFGKIYYAGTAWKEIGPVARDESVLGLAETLGRNLSKRFSEAYAGNMG